MLDFPVVILRHISFSHIPGHWRISSSWMRYNDDYAPDTVVTACLHRSGSWMSCTMQCHTTIRSAGVTYAESRILGVIFIIYCGGTPCMGIIKKTLLCNWSVKCVSLMMKKIIPTDQHIGMWGGELGTTEWAAGFTRTLTRTSPPWEIRIFRNDVYMVGQKVQGWKLSVFWLLMSTGLQVKCMLSMVDGNRDVITLFLAKIIPAC